MNTMRRPFRIGHPSSRDSGSRRVSRRTGGDSCPEREHRRGSPNRDERELIDRYHVLYYSHKPYENSYLGIMSAQYPNDNWMMQEIITELRPDSSSRPAHWRAARRCSMRTCSKKCSRADA